MARLIGSAALLAVLAGCMSISGDCDRCSMSIYRELGIDSVIDAKASAAPAEPASGAAKGK